MSKHLKFELNSYSHSRAQPFVANLSVQRQHASEIVFFEHFTYTHFSKRNTHDFLCSNAVYILFITIFLFIKKPTLSIR